MKESSRHALAHLLRQDDSLQCHEHLLADHLRDVSNLSAEFAQAFDPNSSSWARIAGLWHDLGKYSDAFQDMIRKANGFEAHLEVEGQKGKVNHSSAGALHARTLLGDPAGRMLGYLIAGHHAGLPDWDGGLDGRLNLDDPENQMHYRNACQNEIPPDILLAPDQAKALLQPPSVAASFQQDLGLSLWLRLLFSCLVDADFLDTEAFMDFRKSETRSNYSDIGALHVAFEHYMEDLAKHVSVTEVNRIRAQVLADCRQNAQGKPGIYTLTVPTGGGKTLSSMAFALEHARRNNQKRVIYVLPFTSILEQTAHVFRTAFQSIEQECLIEHHSNLDPEKETPQSRLACENWDAPVILTTNVQFFESLFANRTSRCRKLHRIANSVVILDEAQQIPPEFKKPIEVVMRLLSEFYGVTFLLCTATQPVLDLQIRDEHPQELVSDPEALFQQLKRVEVALPDTLDQPVEWETLASELTEEARVLCIVDRRADATLLHALLPEGTFHLSGLMCAAHRSEVIASVKRQLKDSDLPVRVISTQLVEAGVDIDFPVVYRALAGLDSIAQAAGRCNREGKMARPGQVKVFVPPKPPAIGLLRKAADTARELLQGESSLEITPECFQRYFEAFYGNVNSQDKHDILKSLKPDGGPHIQFKEAAQKFRLIEDDGESVIIPYGEDGKAEELIDKLRHAGPSRERLRAVQRYTVSIPQKTLQMLLSRGDVEEIRPGLHVLVATNLYHPVTGLQCGAEIPFEPAACIV